MAVLDDTGALIIEAAARIYGNDKEAFLLALSAIFTGSQNIGAWATYKNFNRYAGCAGLGRSTEDCAGNTKQFLDSGFNDDFRDEGNQIYHAWSYVAETAFGSGGRTTGTFGNEVHERQKGGSTMDYNLSIRAMDVGADFNSGKVTTYGLGDYIRLQFGENGA